MFSELTPASSHRDEEYAPVYRLPSAYNPLSTFCLPKGDQRHYQQQYADIYFLRLANLKPGVTKIAAAAWEDLNVCAIFLLCF